MRSRQPILDATIGLIETRGFGAVNVAAVAAAAGVTRQTVYSNFGSLQDLVSAAVASVAVPALDGVLTALRGTRTTADYVVELLVRGRREALRQPVLRALLQAERGNPLFDADVMARARPVVVQLLGELRERDATLTGEAFDDLVELVTRLGISFVLFDSDAARTDDDLRGLLGRWIAVLPGLDTPSRSV